MVDDAVVRCRAELERIVESRLAAVRDLDTVGALLQDVEAIVAGELAAAGSVAVACRAGCAWCCTVNVATLAVEGALAAAHLRAALAPDRVEALVARLHRFHSDVRWLEDRERVRGAFRCPFLDARGACSIHAVRPLACRSVSSLSAGDCRWSLASQEEDGPPLVRMNLLQKVLYDEAIDVLRRALQRRELDATCCDVSGMVAAFLDDPEALRGYLRGARLALG